MMQLNITVNIILFYGVYISCFLLLVIQADVIFWLKKSLYYINVLLVCG